MRVALIITLYLLPTVAYGQTYTEVYRYGNRVVIDTLDVDSYQGNPNATPRNNKPLLPIIGGMFMEIITLGHWERPHIWDCTRPETHNGD